MHRRQVIFVGVVACGAIGLLGFAILMPYARDGGAPPDALVSLRALLDGKLLCAASRGIKRPALHQVEQRLENPIVTTA